jgi:sulfotransferase
VEQQCVDMESPFLLLPITSSETLTACRELDVSQIKTIFITSYPKSGTTWLQCIVHQLLSHGDETFSHISDYSPFYESNKTWNDNEFVERYTRNHQRLGARIFNTHLKWNMLPKGDHAIFIYIYRNGRDVVHSFFQHLSNQADSGTYEGTFHEFFSEWVAGKIAYGNWIQHIKDWIDASKDPSNRILLLRYEDLKQNFSSQLKQISDHLGCSYSDVELAEIITPHCTFSFMKEHQTQYQPVSVTWKAGYNFIRKGIVGDSDTIFNDPNESYRELLHEMTQREFPDGIPQWFEDYLL